MRVAENGAVWRLEPWREDGKAGGASGNGSILSPMPGRILSVEVAVGDRVTRGQKLLTLEAMKMEHSLIAPFDGILAELHAVAGAQVQVDALLAKVLAD
jgi:3-methylcrotonyl-CoA carboxylase alpha subunit